MQSSEWVFKRDFLQIVVFLSLFILTLSHTSVTAKKDLSHSGQKTLAYTLIGGDEETDIEEIVAEPRQQPSETSYSWKTGVITVTELTPGAPKGEEQYIASVVAGGTALNKPILMPGAALTMDRSDLTEYTVEPGDSIGGIAYEYGVSIATIMWENGLNARSIIRPGDVLKIPPTTGVMHTVKKGDTLSKIAKLYDAESVEIIRFNRLKEDGSDLKVGERLMVPNGVKNQTTPTVRPTTPAYDAVARRAAPPRSNAQPSISGFVWPTAAKLITQYYGFRHHALDIAGPKGTAIYAAKAGTVEVSQCGWNSGYGCYIIINHGDGVKTLYGHNWKLLVEPGDYVDTGQTIALMGNTGKVRGVTGVHTHFEIQLKGARVNPLGYIK